MLLSLWDLSSPVRNGTQALAVKVQSPNHWITREFPFMSFSFTVHIFSFLFFFLIFTMSCWFLPYRTTRSSLLKTISPSILGFLCSYKYLFTFPLSTGVPLPSSLCFVSVPPETIQSWVLDQRAPRALARAGLPATAVFPRWARRPREQTPGLGRKGSRQDQTQQASSETASKGWAKGHCFPASTYPWFRSTW